MATIGVVGLGAMGSRIARRFAGAGHDLDVWNRDRLAKAARNWLAEAEEAGLGGADYSAVLVPILDRSRTPASQEESSDR